MIASLTLERNALPEPWWCSWPSTTRSTSSSMALQVTSEMSRSIAPFRCDTALVVTLAPAFAGTPLEGTAKPQGARRVCADPIAGATSKSSRFRLAEDGSRRHVCPPGAIARPSDQRYRQAAAAVAKHGYPRSAAVADVGQTL